MNTTPTYEIKTSKDLTKFLLGSITALRRGEISHEDAHSFSILADKVIKNNIAEILEARRVGDDTPIEFFNKKANQSFMLQDK